MRAPAATRDRLGPGTRSGLALGQAGR